jgi:hypothetical protein
MDASGNLVQQRTPFLWFVNAYAEYNLRLGGRYSLQLSVNVDNLFDIKTARRIQSNRNYYDLSVSEEQVLSTNWNLADPGIDHIENSLYGKEMDFYPPISVRFGAKFFF